VPKQSVTNSDEMMMVARSAALVPEGVSQNGVPRKIAAVAKPATSAAAANLQIAAIKPERERSAGAVNSHQRFMHRTAAG